MTRSIPLKANEFCSWGNLARWGNNPVVRKSYYWILILPLAANFITKYPEIEVLPWLFPKHLAIPSPWVFSYISALCFAAATFIFRVWCPDIVLRFSDYGEFQRNGGSHLYLTQSLFSLVGYSDLSPQSREDLFAHEGERRNKLSQYYRYAYGTPLDPDLEKLANGHRLPDLKQEYENAWRFLRNYRGEVDVKQIRECGERTKANLAIWKFNDVYPYEAFLPQVFYCVWTWQSASKPVSRWACGVLYGSGFLILMLLICYQSRNVWGILS